MFRHLLVPLDGSRLAEAALPMAAYLAGKLHASVTLVHIIERGAPEEVHGERHLTAAGEAHVYLEGVAGREFPEEVHVERHVHTAEMSDVARGIVDHIGELAPDLIVMCTHGSGGLRDVLAGSIAQQVVARGTTPVLLIRPRDAVEPVAACLRLLVPLDGNPEHQQGLLAAAELARACSAQIHLVFVVPTLGTLAGQQAATGRLLPGATTAVLDLAQRNAEAYLRERIDWLQGEGLNAIAEVRRGEPVNVILEAARATRAGMIVVGTHGRAGLVAFWSGSAAAKISGRSTLPLLLVPVIDQE